MLIRDGVPCAPPAALNAGPRVPRVMGVTASHKAMDPKPFEEREGPPPLVALFALVCEANAERAWSEPPHT